MSWKFRLGLNGDGSDEISTMSQFETMLDMMEQMLRCIELREDFPIENLLLSLINYSMLMEESQLESQADRVERVFLDYLTLPIPSIVFRILKKILMRLQMREELLKV